MDDLTAIEKCKAGQADAFNHLVKKYQSEAIGHAMAILSSREDALDAVQDAFVAAYETIRFASKVSANQIGSRGLIHGATIKLTNASSSIKKEQDFLCRLRD